VVNSYPVAAFVPRHHSGAAEFQMIPVGFPGELEKGRGTIAEQAHGVSS
jgi:hypothetical protein